MNLTLRVDRKDVRTLVKEIGNVATYLLPTFQRDFVWDEKDVKEFIDSIIKGYPIGNIILWKPSRNVYENDPFSKPIIGEKNFDNEVYYVIDGQQRLTTLILMFNNWRIRRENEEIELTPISINLEGENYKLYVSSKFTNIYELLKSIAGSPIFDPFTYNQLHERLDSNVFDKLCTIADRILSYEIPLYILQTCNEDEKVYKDMAEAFVRVNKSGVSIGNVEMILSLLAGTVRGSFKNDIYDIYRSLENFKIDLQPIIRAVLSEFGVRQSDIKPERFGRIVREVQNIDESERRSKVNRVSRAFQLTVKFLKERLGVKDTRILPSQIPLVVISKYFASKDITDLNQIDPEVAKSMESWFVLVNFMGYYSSQTDTKLEEDLKTVRKHSDFPFEELSNNMERRRFPTKIRREDLESGLRTNVLRGKQGRSYLFLLYILLVKNDATDWAGELIRVRPFDNLDRHHIFPRDFLRENLEIEGDRDILINNIGNITFIKKEIDSAIGNTPPSEYLPRYRSYIEKHFIPMDENLWKLETYETFLRARIDKIYLKAREFYPEIFE